MLVPHTYVAALLVMLASMLCWGSWANTLKLCPGYRFQLFYWDYALGVVLAAMLFGVTVGSHGADGTPFLADVVQMTPSAMWLAVAGGVVFNIANLLLVAAIDVAGLAVAFPVGIGLALVVGSVWSYLVNPKANAFLLFGGVALVTVAIVFDAAAYRRREMSVRGKPKSEQSSTRGLVLSLVAGVLMGSFYPLVAEAMTGSELHAAPGPYAIALLFSVGVLVSTFPANLLLMFKPLDGKPPVSISGYWEAPFSWHAAGLIGGAVWCCGAVANFAGSGAHQVGPAVSYAIGQGATMISACWGVFVWHEFAQSPRAAKRLLTLMFIFFIVGLSAVALAPLY